MSKLDKIIYIADKVSYDIISEEKENIKKLSLENLDYALAYLINQEYNKLIKEGLALDKSTAGAYEK
jgi:HD superfamily phosphohydrolase YqeK